MSVIERPLFPIIFVRGHTGNDTEIEDTVSAQLLVLQTCYSYRLV